MCVPATRGETVGSTIRAIRRQTWIDWELIVLGQGPQDVLEAAVRSASGGDQRVRYVQLSGRGLSLARNAALELVAGSVVAFTDDDCEPRPDWLATFAQAFLADPRVGVVGGAVLSPKLRGLLTSCPTVTPTEALYTPTAGHRTPPVGWDWIGANFAIRREVARKLGTFDECLGAGADFPAAEDTDYKLRLEAAGIRMLTTPRAAVVHTYGVRKGWALLRSQQNYATGNGGMAGKLTLLGDSRGAEWLEETRDGSRKEWRGAPHRLPRSLRRLHYFSSAYERCLRNYRIINACLRRS
ncbi:MAG TPA: glycosyltransferase family 2 protein [Candidatus Dormibacteraeota bacterium]|nr:glycosyltransferase family 2 protein [Candidatus Dormibacteraeota bacterium]